MKTENEVKCAWNILVQLEDLLWEYYDDDFLALEMDQNPNAYLEQQQFDNIPL
jgi:hypothetical protein